MLEKLYSKLTKSESLDWLKRNDPEYDWESQGCSASELREVIGDNLQSFGVEAQSPGLRVRFPRRGCYQNC